jgi:hypothetical protein
MDLMNTDELVNELRGKVVHKKVTKKKAVRTNKPIKKSEYRNIYHLLRDFYKVGEVCLTDRQRSILYELESIGKKKTPSHAYLAVINNTSESSIKRDLNALKALNVITWERYSNQTNWYYLNEELIAEQSGKLLKIWKSRYEDSEDDDVFINKHLDWKLDRPKQGKPELSNDL